MQTAKPLLIISGFLGAGKTTLLRRILAELDARELRSDVILNDFENATIDAATLNKHTTTTVAPIAAGCACCESLDELLTLCEAAASGAGDLLLLELNGTADPLALLESFTLVENKLPFFPRLQVCVVDARHWGKRNEFSRLEARQLESAGFWLLTHTERVNHAQLQELRSTLRRMAPNSVETTALQMVQILASEEGQKITSPLGIPRLYQPAHDPIGGSDRPIAPSSRHLDDTVHGLSHRFTGWQIKLPHKVRSASMKRLLRRLPKWVMRAKALVKLVEEPGCRWLFEKVGDEVIPHPLPVHELRHASSSIVCIGPRLDTEKLQALVVTEFGVQPPPTY
tara:strand:- start:1305 stop:2324 length:1020 start_codon:yes stop_codon:yes gene_type:complete